MVEGSKRVDEDWKNRVVQEKTKVVGKEQTEPRSAAGPHPLFSQFITSLAIQAMMHMGQAPDEAGRGLPVDISAAKYLIDVLDALKAKTQGNLTTEETALLEDHLYRLHMLYVEVVGKMAPKGGTRG